MSKHSLGPWKVEVDTSLGMGESHAHPWKIVDATNRTLMCDTKYYPWCPEKEADWQLIAAAPDLLAALKALLAEAKSMGYALDQEFIVAADGDRSEPTFDAAEAAIAKAEGEEKDRSLKP